MKTFYVGFFILITSIVLAQNSPAYPVITGVVINGCGPAASAPCANITGVNDGYCAEGRSEVYFFRNGTTAITAAQVQAMPASVIQYWSSSPCSGAPQYYTGISENVSATTTYMNANACSGSCGTCFKDAWTTGIPTNASFLLVSSYFCPQGTDFTNLCTNPSTTSPTNPTYIIYFETSTNNSNICGYNSGSTGTWNAGGDFANSGGARCFAIDFSFLGTGAPIEYYDYTAGGSTGTDGDGIALGSGSTTNTSPAAPASYVSGGCTLPVVLPINLMDFTATKTNEDNVMLKWATATEINDDYFTVEYSLDGVNFTAYKEVKGAGNSTEIKNYTCPFYIDVTNETPYFRLKQVDKNGVYQYSNIISLPGTTTQIKTYYNKDMVSIVSKFTLNTPEQVSFNLYDVTGQLIYTSVDQFKKGDNEFLIPAPEVEGVYFLVYQNGSSAPVHKKVMVTK